MLSACRALRLQAQPTAIAFHPFERLIYVGDIDGRVVAVSLDASEPDSAGQKPLAAAAVAAPPPPPAVAPRQTRQTAAHASTCRALACSPSGDCVLSASKLGGLTLLDVASGESTPMQPEASSANDRSYHAAIAIDAHSFAVGAPPRWRCSRH